MVGVKGFEPSAPWSQTKCANQTAPHPVFILCGRELYNLKICLSIVFEKKLFFLF